MDSFKDAAKRLVARLRQGGVEISASLSYECIAAVHGAKSWNVLSATREQAGGVADKQRASMAAVASAAPPALTRQPAEWRYSGRHGRADALSPKGRCSILIGISGTGKTVLGLSYLRQVAAETGVPTAYFNGIEGAAELEGAQPIEAMAAWGEANPPGVVLVDEWMWGKGREPSVGAMIQALRRKGHDVYVTAQGAADVEALDVEDAGVNDGSVQMVVLSHRLKLGTVSR